MSDPINPDQGSELISVEIAYALPDRQQIIALTVPAGTTAFDAVVLSKITDKFEGIDLNIAKMGVFGKVIKPKVYELLSLDRVEIYRPLLVDPKASRKARAEKSKQENKR